MLLAWTQRALLLAIAFAVLIAATAADGPKPPKFLTKAAYFSEGFAIEIDVLIEPHADIRYVVLEAWEAQKVSTQVGDEGESFDFYEVGELTRTSDSQPVTELSRNKRAYHFLWRQGLPAGTYYLICRLATTNFRPVVDAKKLIHVT